MVTGRCWRLSREFLENFSFQEPHHDSHIEPWIRLYEHQYRSFTYKGPHNFLSDKEGRNLGIAHCKKVKCNYYFSVDGDVTLSSRNALKSLLQQNRWVTVKVVNYTSAFRLDNLMVQGSRM